MRPTKREPGIIVRAFVRLKAVWDGSLGATIRSMMAELTPTGQFWARAGIFFTCISASMAFKFGWQISLDHALLLAGVSIICAMGLEVAYYQAFVQRRWLSGLGLLLAMPVFFAIEFGSHLGQTSSSRALNVGEARVQNMSFGDNRANVTNLQGEVDKFKATAQRLDEDLDKLTSKKVGDWSVSVRPASSTSLDGAISAKQLEVANETKRGGCGARCELRTNELAHLKSLKEAAAAIEKNRGELGTALEALAAASKQAATGPAFKHSAVANSTEFAVDAVRVFWLRSEDVPSLLKQLIELGWTTLLAIGATLAAMYCFFVAGLNRRDGADLEPEAVGDQSLAGTTLLDDFYENVKRHLPRAAALQT